MYELARADAYACRVARIAVTEFSGPSQVSMLLDAACLLIDATLCTDVAAIKAVAEAWSAMTGGRHAVLLVNPNEFGRVSAMVHAVANTGALSAVCLSDCQAEARAGVLAALWLSQLAAAPVAETKPSSPQHARARAPGRPGWHPTAELGQAHIH